MLVEVAFTVDKGHGDEGDLEIGGGADGVAGEDAEASAVGGDGGVEANFHGEVSNPLSLYKSALTIFATEVVRFPP